MGEGGKGWEKKRDNASQGKYQGLAAKSEAADFLPKTLLAPYFLTFKTVKK